MPQTATLLKEQFEPKDGAEQLFERVCMLTDHEAMKLVCGLFGSYQAQTHEDWAKFKGFVESTLKHMEVA